MAKKSENLAIVGVVLLLGLLILPLAVEGGPAVVGTLAGSISTSVDGQPGRSDTVIYSGDALQVGDGAAVLALERGNRVLLGKNTRASLVRDSLGVKVTMDRGQVTLLQTQEGAPLRVQAGKVTVFPASGFKTLGEVALVTDGVAVAVGTGRLRVEHGGTARELRAGEAITIGAPNNAAGGPFPSGAGPAMNFSSRATVWGLLLAAALGTVVATAVLSKNEQSTSPSRP